MKKDTIFVSIASYRDKICPKTLGSIFDNARHPSNVFIGICQQNDPNDVDCIEEGLKDKPELRCHVRILRLSHHQAKGPTFARFLCSTLYQDEEYFLQIDSHCQFVRDWDVILINMINDLKQNGVPKPVLSHYTPNYTDYQPVPDPNTPISTICKAWFTDANLISLQGAGWVQPDDLPRPNAYIAAGMFFCEGKFLKEIPFDPELDYLFIGEELLLSARFYTNGWDIFTPNKNTIYHLYTRESDPKFWENQHIDAEGASQKTRFILGLDLDKSKLSPRQIHSISLYGLGKERTLDEYYRHAGIDLQKKEVIKNMCEDNRLRIERKHNGTEPIENPIMSMNKQKRKNSSSSSGTGVMTLCMWCVFFIFLVILVWGVFNVERSSNRPYHPLPPRRHANNNPAYPLRM